MSCCGVTIEAHRNADLRKTYGPRSRNYTFSGFSPLMQIRDGTTVLLSITLDATAAGSLFAVSGDALVLTIKKTDILSLTNGDDDRLLSYDIVLTQGGLEDWFLGGDFIVLDVNDATCEGDSDVTVELGGQSVDVTISGGNIGVGASVLLADLNAAVESAEQSAEEAQQALIDINTGLAGKASIPLDNTSFRPFTGGILRSAPSKMRDVVDIRDFDVDPTGNNSSAAGIAAALLEGRYRRLNLGNGIFVWDNPEPMLINQPIQIYGAGRRSLSTIGTTLKFVGTGTKAVRTFEKAPADGSDDPISCQIIVSSSFVHMEDLNILTNFDPATSTIDNPGDDWDVSLMVTGQSPNFTTTRIRNNGYPRMAGLLFDVTQPSGGMDQHLSESCWWKGGLYGMWIRGPIPPTPNVDPVPGDTRGQGGMSSSLWLNPVFQGFDHFSRIRYNDTVGGGFKVSGRIPTIYNRINDNTMIGARTTSFEPEAYNVDWASGFCMIKQHPERQAGFLRDGITGVSAANTNARVTANARNVSMINGDIGNMTIDWSTTEGVVFHQGIRKITNSGLEPFLAPTIANLQNYGAPTLLPRLRGSTGQLSGGTPYATQSCRYNKTTGQVTVNITLVMSDITGLSGNLTIDQLPFSRRTDVGAPQILAEVTVANVDTGTDAAPIKATLNAGQNSITLFKQRDGATLQNVTAADLVATSAIYITITYPVDPNAVSI